MARVHDCGSCTGEKEGVVTRFEPGQLVTVIGTRHGNPTCDEPCEVLRRANVPGHEIYMVAMPTPVGRGFVEYAVAAGDLQAVGVPS